jgi:hypothetical protein
MQEPLERIEQPSGSRTENVPDHTYYQALYDHHLAMMDHYAIVQDLFQTVEEIKEAHLHNKERK